MRKIITFIKSCLYDLYQVFRYTTGKTKLYHYGEAKAGFPILKELLSWRIKEREFNTMYYAMGLNLKDTRQSDFIGRREFLRIKDKAEKILKQKMGCPELNYDVVCKDKFISGSLFKANCLPCAETIALIRQGKVLGEKFAGKALSELLANKGIFILKQLTLEASEGFLYCEPLGNQIKVNGEVLSAAQFEQKLSLGIWIMQNRLVSHAAIRKINDTALNTTRIVTILNGSEPEYLGGFQGFATNGENTDSWSNGSVYVGIDKDKECLLGKGFYNLSVKNKSVVYEHPDSKVVFKGYPIPLLKEAIELCIRAHRLLYFNFIIGWDIAITDNGPVIVEANEKPGMSVVQCIDGCLRKRILDYAAKICRK